MSGQQKQFQWRMERVGRLSSPGVVWVMQRVEKVRGSAVTTYQHSGADYNRISHAASGYSSASLRGTCPTCYYSINRSSYKKTKVQLQVVFFFARSVSAWHRVF